jgi:hypothetical protein
LFKPTRDGETEIAILTTLPLTAASAVQVADLYRKRWSVETLFQTVTTNFEGEIQTLQPFSHQSATNCRVGIAHKALLLWVLRSGGQCPPSPVKVAKMTTQTLGKSLWAIAKFSFLTTTYT